MNLVDDVGVAHLHTAVTERSQCSATVRLTLATQRQAADRQGNWVRHFTHRSESWDARQRLSWALRQLLETWEKGAKSDVETLLSWPSPRRITEYVWLPSTSSTGSPLFRTWRRRRTGPGCNNHEGCAEPAMVLRGNHKKRSWGVSLVERQTRDRTSWIASGRTDSQQSWINYIKSVQL